MVEPATLQRHFAALLVIASHGVGQASIGVAKDIAVCALAEVVHVGLHVFSTQGTVETHSHGVSMTNAVPESLVGLSAEGTA